MQEMQQLVSQLNKYAYDYYVLDNPRISDGEYDALYDKLLLLEKRSRALCCRIRPQEGWAGRF